MKKLNTVASLFATAALAASASGAFAQTTIDNWVDSSGNVWKNGTNELCWRDSNWTPPVLPLVTLTTPAALRVRPVSGAAAALFDVPDHTNAPSGAKEAPCPSDSDDKNG